MTRADYCVTCGRSHPPRPFLTVVTDAHRMRYRAGASRFPAPPVPTHLWDEDAWVRWIDGHGEWTAPIVAPLEAGPLKLGTVLVHSLGGPGALSVILEEPLTCSVCSAFASPGITRKDAAHRLPDSWVIVYDKGRARWACSAHCRGELHAARERGRFA